MLIIYAIELVTLSVGIGLHLFHDIGYILCYSFLCPFLLLFEVWVKILIICKIIKYKDVKQVFCMIFFRLWIWAAKGSATSTRKSIENPDNNPITISQLRNQ